MKKFLLLSLLVAIAGGAYFVLQPAPEPAFTLEDGYHYLYDGETLAGWHSVGGESTFDADGEDIVGYHGPGANTFLRTDKSYALMAGSMATSLNSTILIAPGVAVFTTRRAAVGWRIWQTSRRCVQ